MAKILRCYAVGHDGEWEAICLDLDIAVQGRGFEDVFHSLNEAVSLYLESLSDFSEKEQERFLNRSAPFRVRFRFFWWVLMALFRSNDHGDCYHHQFTMPVTA